LSDKNIVVDVDALFEIGDHGHHVEIFLQLLHRDIVWLLCVKLHEPNLMLTLISAAKCKWFHILVQSHWTTVYVHVASQHETLFKHIVVGLLIHSTAIIALVAMLISFGDVYE
jgi:hypothetical protein